MGRNGGRILCEGSLFFLVSFLITVDVYWVCIGGRGTFDDFLDMVRIGEDVDYVFMLSRFHDGMCGFGGICMWMWVR